MKKLIAGVAFVLTLCGAHAQPVNQALVVAACGTVPITYTAGQVQLPTVDVNGKLCLSSGGTPGGAAGGVLSGTYPNPGFAASLPSATFGSSATVTHPDSSTWTSSGISGLVKLGVTPAANSNAITISGGSITGSSTVSPGLTITAAASSTGSIDGVFLFGNLTSNSGPLNVATRLLDLQVGGISQFYVDISGNNFLNGALTATGYAYISGNIWFGPSYRNILTSAAAATLQLGAAASSSAAVGQTLQAQGSSAASATGPDFKISGSNQTGTTSIGGDLLLTGGTGTSSNGYVKFGTVAANIAVTAAGTIAIKDAGGTLRYLMYTNTP